jgi:hypothetical protein
MPVPLKSGSVWGWHSGRDRVSDPNGDTGHDLAELNVLDFTAQLVSG